MNAHDAVLDAVLQVLRQPPAITAGLIDEDVDIGAVPEGVMEVVSVSIDSSNPNRNALRGAPIQWGTDVMLECYARADGRHQLTAGRASRALHQRAYARLMQDPSLGGVLIDLLPPQIRGDRDQQDTRLGCCIAIYQAVHRTQAHSLEQPV